MADSRADPAFGRRRKPPDPRALDRPDAASNVPATAIVHALRQARLELHGGARTAPLGAIARTLVSRITRAFDGSPTVPDRLRKALELLLGSDVPVHTVNRLAREIGWSASTLRRDWNRVVDGRLPLSLLLKLIVAARYQTLREQRLSAVEAADRLGLTVKAVRKRCRRLRRDLRALDG